MWYTKYGPTTMQGWKGCDQLQTNQTIILTDARDNNQYTVAKLLDGQCWTTQDSKLIDITITYMDSDIESGSFEIINHNSYQRNDNIDQNMAYKNPNTGYVYYSWFTATAGTGRIALYVNSEAPSSICPKNWRLPKKDDCYSLSSYGSLFVPPFNLIMNGFDGNAVGLERHWTSTKTSSNGAWSTYSPSQSDGVGLGAGIRCIFRE